MQGIELLAATKRSYSFSVCFLAVGMLFLLLCHWWYCYACCLCPCSSRSLPLAVDMSVTTTASVVPSVSSKLIQIHMLVLPGDAAGAVVLAAAGLAALLPASTLPIWNRRPRAGRTVRCCVLGHCSSERYAAAARTQLLVKFITIGVKAVAEP
mgnify:CR=1 FL=1